MLFLTFVCRSFLLSAIAAALAVAAVALLSSPAAGGMVFTASGTSGLGNPVKFAATVTIDGDNLEIVLDNVSPRDTTDAADVLTSFYFDIWNGKDRPNLRYESASGFVFQVNKGLNNDVAVFYSPPMPPQPATHKESNLVAQNRGDASWQFAEMNAAAAPGLGFGIGTVANNALSPNGFTPAVVGPQGSDFINFGIYRLIDTIAGDSDPNGGLNNKYLVQNTATFKFTGASGYKETDIQPRVVFALGTSPDSIVVVPEPSPLAIAGGAMVLAAWRARRRGERGCLPAAGREQPS